MNYSRTILWSALLLIFAACEESLPPRIEPENALAVTDVLYVQGTYAAGPFMEFVFTITNNYSETFQEKVNIVGEAMIWLQKTPSVRATVSIGNQHVVAPSKMSGNVLTIDPGGRCVLKIYWYLNLDDGRYLLNLLDYSGSEPRDGMIKSKPETFVMEADIKLFNQLGYLQSKRLTYSFVGYKKAETGI